LKLRSKLPKPEESGDLISQGNDATSTLEGTEEAHKKMQEKDDSLVSWLACLAKQEVLFKYKPTEEDITWIKRIAKFYHVLVPLMRIVLKAKFDGKDGKRPPVNVFVSHTGANKESYAANLANYLEDNDVPKVFIDKDIWCGSVADDEMMWAAVV
jgi:hypothetical protein